MEDSLIDLIHSKSPEVPALVLNASRAWNKWWRRNALKDFFVGMAWAFLGSVTLVISHGMGKPLLYFEVAGMVTFGFAYLWASNSADKLRREYERLLVEAHVAEAREGSRP